jgi:hypothetical protein
MSRASFEANLNDIRAAIKILFEPGQTAEIRVPGKWDTISGYFDDHEELAKAVKELSDSGRHAGVYYTLNPCHEALLARRTKNKLHDRVTSTTRDTEIKRRRWLLLDFDPRRPEGVSATREEKQAAKELAQKVESWLTEQGWPQPVVALSANGYHLLFRVDEPNDADSTDLFKKCLTAIAERFATDAVDIDTKVFNAARITKAYGSLAAKGVNTKERPHRYSRILRSPEPVCLVSHQQLETLAAHLTKTKKLAPIDAEQKHGTIDAAKVEEFLGWGEIPVEKRTEKPDGTLMWSFDCVFNPQHRDAAVFLLPNGALQYKCFHKSCEQNRWAEFRASVEQQRGEPFRFETAPAPYVATENGLCWRRFTDDSERLVPLTNFTARIVTEIREDDGVAVRHVFAIEASLNGRTKTVHVPASEF